MASAWFFGKGLGMVIGAVVALAVLAWRVSQDRWARAGLVEVISRRGR